MIGDAPDISALLDEIDRLQNVIRGLVGEMGVCAMSNEEYDRIFAKHSRSSATVTLELQRYMFDGKPVCLAWSGMGSNDRMCCQFLFLERFGTQNICGCLGVTIHDNTPDDDCPLWRDAK